MQAGVVLNPSTPVGAIEEVARDVDFVLVMSVNPGFGGQSFIPAQLDKIRRVRALLDRAGSARADRSGRRRRSRHRRDVVAAGASILVAGNAIFGGGDPAASRRALRQAAAQ